MNEMAGSIEKIYVSHHISQEPTPRSLHKHNTSYEMMLFKSGNVDYFINDITYHLNPGDLTLICPGDIHGLFVKDETPYERIPVHIGKIYVNHFSTPRTDLFACFHHSISNRVYHLSDKECQQYEHLALEVLNSILNKEFGYDINITASVSLLLLLVNKICESHTSAEQDISPPIIKQAIQYINSHLTEELSVQMIANSLNISRSRLSHLFRQFTGISLWKYIISRRIQHAQTLLQQGYTITEACYGCGFHDYSHFLKVFTELNGISPGKYTASLYADPYPSSNRVEK